MSKLDSKIPPGPLADKWNDYKAHIKLVNPSNKRKLDVIIVGTGLAGGAAAADRAQARVRVVRVHAGEHLVQLGAGDQGDTGKQPVPVARGGGGV